MKEAGNTAHRTVWTVIVDSMTLSFPATLASHSRLLLGTGLAVSALIFGAAGSPELSASAGSLLILQDSDQDGLDDALEARLGTDSGNPDTDGDYLSDLQEIMQNTNPLVADPSGSVSPPDTAAFLGLYALGSDFVLEVYGQSQSGILDFSMARALPTGLRTYSAQQTASALVDIQHFGASAPGWKISRARFLLSADWFESQSSVSLAAILVMDNASLASAVQLSMVSGELAELVWDPQALVGGGGGANGGTGGLFPARPGGDGPPASGTTDQVCIQVLTPIASLGGGRMAYQVSDAYCDPLASAICLVGCSGTIGDTVVGIDLIGLLGG